MKNDQHFTSPIRLYITQQLQASLQFGKKYDEKKVKTFETLRAGYEVCVKECYLTKEEAGEKSSSLDQSRRLESKSALFFSSSWFEVYKINNHELDVEYDQCIHEGNSEETADILLKLDDGHRHFSYCKQDRFSKPEIFDGCAFKSRPLNEAERKSLDYLIKQRLDSLYRR